jgi:catalase (peroxidase I)
MVIMDHSLLEWLGSAGTYRTADGRGGSGAGSQRFAPTQ